MMEPSGVNVSHRVECQPAGQTRCRVAEPVGHVTVRHLVEDDGKDKNNEAEDNVYLHDVQTMVAYRGHLYG